MNWFTKELDLSKWPVKFILTTFIIRYFTCELKSFYLHCRYYTQKSTFDLLSTSLSPNGCTVLLSVVYFSHPIHSKMMYILKLIIPFCVHMCRYSICKVFTHVVWILLTVKVLLLGKIKHSNSSLWLLNSSLWHENSSWLNRLQETSHPSLDESFSP